MEITKPLEIVVIFLFCFCVYFFLHDTMQLDPN